MVANQMALASAFRDKRILVTGHTGFKGSWLCQWLINLGAHVRGFALAPPTSPSLFEQLHLSECMEDVRADIRDAARIKIEIEVFRPDFVFHLAAQPLVRYSYQNPVETYGINVMGTVHLLDALRILDQSCTVIIVTTDKCYENQEWVFGYRESDPMGGADPYSSSKGMAELAVSAYRRSYFRDGKIRIASVRAGNVIGGGDWASDRIVPDCVRALQADRPVIVRNQHSRRPWQHVLDPLYGYLLLASELHEAPMNSELLSLLSSGFNFGPDPASNRTVRELVEELLRYWPGRWENHSDLRAPHEARLLQLCIDKARALLQWKPLLEFEESVQWTCDWYRMHCNGQDSTSLTKNQIDAISQRIPVT